MLTIVNFSIAAGTMDPEDFIEVSTRQSHLPHTITICIKWYQMSHILHVDYWYSN